MVETFTKAIVREIGRNYGKAASNKLLGDAHSTPYRRVGNNPKVKSVLGSSSGGYKYENQLDRLIRTFQIKGKVATFNSAQNIYNEYFKLVEEANADNDIIPSEAIYLVRQYYRTAKTLNKISIALKEMGAKEKSQIIVEKVINLNEFMKSLDENYEEVKGKELIVNKLNNTYSTICSVVFLISLFAIVLSFISSKYNLNEMLLYALTIITILSFVLMWHYSLKYSREKKEVENYNLNLNLAIKLKHHISKAANSISVEGLKE